MSEGDPIAVQGATSLPAPRAQDDAKPKGNAVWNEIKGIFWLITSVLAFHSLIAKPFYIPSESMMPVLLKGDRLVVSKFPYGWSWVSASFHLLPERPGRILPRTPKRGDIVILTPPSRSEDYIKRVIGVPGDTIAVTAGRVTLNGVSIRRVRMAPTMIPVDANTPCTGGGFENALVRGADGRAYCRLPVFRETLPGGRYYDTIDMTDDSMGDYREPITVTAGHVFVMGDNRDNSADSRFPIEGGGLGGPVPLENIGGRAELITFSLDGTASLFNPISWFTSLRGGRAGSSLHPREE